MFCSGFVKNHHKLNLKISKRYVTAVVIWEASQLQEEISDKNENVSIPISYLLYHLLSL